MTFSDSLPSEAGRPRGPWDDPTPAEAPKAAPKPPAQGSQLAWGLVSTALLAAWLTWQFGWVFAVAGVLGVFVHEFGHLMVINALGCGPSRIVIIPFFGGAATMARSPDTEFKGVLIALAGPVAGLIAMAPFVLLHVVTGEPIWLRGALFVAAINLFNLIPAPPLDGAKALGPVLAWIHPWLERGVMVLIGAAVVAWAAPRGSYMLALLAGVFVLRAVQGKAFRPPALRMSLGQWGSAAGLYAAAVALCAGAAAASALAVNWQNPLGYIHHLGI